MKFGLSKQACSVPPYQPGLRAMRGTRAGRGQRCPCQGPACSPGCPRSPPPWGTLSLPAEGRDIFRPLRRPAGSQAGHALALAVQHVSDLQGSQERGRSPQSSRQRGPWTSSTAGDGNPRLRHLPTWTLLSVYESMPHSNTGTACRKVEGTRNPQLPASPPWPRGHNIQGSVDRTETQGWHTPPREFSERRLHFYFEQKWTVRISVRGRRHTGSWSTSAPSGCGSQGGLRSKPGVRNSCLPFQVQGPKSSGHPLLRSQAH